MRKNKKKRSVKVIVFLIVLLVIVISSLLYFGFTYFNSNEQKLKHTGYSKDEISLILANLYVRDVDYLVDNDYIKDVKVIIDNKEFKKDKFRLYLDYYLKYSPDITIDDTLMVVNLGFDKYDFSEFLVDIINDDNFDSLKMDKYIKYHLENGSASVADVIFLVNKNIDKPYSEMLVSIIKEKYYIEKRLDRYLAYASRSKVSAKNVVTNVNTNLDYSFYTNIKNVDTSKGILMLVNKYFKLSKDYSYGTLVSMDAKYTNVGHMLNKEAYEAFKKLVDDAEKEGYYIRNASGYRSYETQSSIYNNYINTNGQVWADTWSARPGHSEHQTGLALDVAVKGAYLGSFQSSKEFAWMNKNCYKYGFIIRYPEGKEYITGYGYEPWHYRYVGTEVAKYIYDNKITFDEYYAFYIE